MPVIRTYSKELGEYHVHVSDEKRFCDIWMTHDSNFLRAENHGLSRLQYCYELNRFLQKFVPSEFDGQPLFGDGI